MMWLTGRRAPWLGLLFSIPLTSGCAQAADVPTPQPNIVLITIDTLRADHLGCYGYPRETSPSIDRLAESGLLFERALSAAPWTLPSMASIHTSLYPPEHGAILARTRLPENLTTLAESLQGAGYDTMALVTHIFVSGRYGFAKGFRIFDESLVQGPDAVTSEELTKNALRYLRRSRREPFFLWVHYFDPHFSYVRHPEFGFVDVHPFPDLLTFKDLRIAEVGLRDDAIPDRYSVESVKAVYDEEIAYTDAAIGRLLEGIEQMNLNRPTVTVLTGDHGEYFMERGRFGHGRDVYDELVHVPLIISGDIDEELRGRRVPETVETASIAHTLAELAQVDHNPFHGENLLSSDHPEHRTVFSYGCYAWGADGRKIMAEADGWKLIRNLDDDRFELYDVRRDPREVENEIDQGMGPAGSAKKALRAALDAFSRGPGGEGSAIEPTPEETRRMEALGYVQ